MGSNFLTCVHCLLFPFSLSPIFTFSHFWLFSSGLLIDIFSISEDHRIAGSAGLTPMLIEL